MRFPVPRELVGAGISTARLGGGGGYQAGHGITAMVDSLILSYFHSFLVFLETQRTGK